MQRRLTVAQCRWLVEDNVQFSGTDSCVARVNIPAPLLSVALTATTPLLCKPAVTSFYFGMHVNDTINELFSLPLVERTA